jgi:hypothetical protein
MAFWDPVTRVDVVRAIEEYDRLSPERFFAEYGFGPAGTYVLCYGGRSCHSKAILSAAYRFATGQRLGSGDFGAGKDGAVSVLRGLGFDVRDRRHSAAPGGSSRLTAG